MDVLLKYIFGIFLILTPCLASSCACKLMVEIEQGKISGKESLDKNNGTFYSFLSIPYAKPPLEKLRFKAPEDPEPWTGTRDGTIDLPQCPQFHLVKMLEKPEIIGQEDCLYLNIHTPNTKLKENEKLQPVMVFIHGGAYIEGSGTTVFYGADYLMPAGVVLVTINYRLGTLGFISSTDDSLGVPGNAGLKDQTMALKWVKKNIHKFGGDPDNVTIFGESAGGGSVHFHVLSPMSKGLFHKAISMSGTARNPWNNGIKGTMEINAKKLNIATDDKVKMLELMQALPVRDILENQKSDGLIIPIHEPFDCSPVIETQTSYESFLPAFPKDIIKSGNYNKVPFIVGYTDKDGLVLELISRLYTGKPIILNDISPMIPSDLELNSDEQVIVKDKIKTFYFGGEEASEKNLNSFTDLGTDTYFTAGISKTIKEHVANNDNIYLYRFSADTGLNVFKNIEPHTATISGACHVDDLGYLFRTVLTPHFEKDSVEDKAIDMIVGLWSNFAKHGVPTSPESNIQWLPVTKDAMNYLEISTTLTPGVSPDKKRVKFWEDIYNSYGKYEALNKV